MLLSRAPSFCQIHGEAAAAPPAQHVRRQPLRVAAVQQQRQQACHQPGRRARALLQQLACKGAACALAAALVVPGCGAADVIGSFGASGFFFKDSVEVVSIEDPDVKGVSIYISDFKRSLPDKLAKNFFDEPSQASVTCATTGPVVIDAKSRSRIRGSEGHEVFSEAKGLNVFRNKSTRVRRHVHVHAWLTSTSMSQAELKDCRIFDEKHDTLLYVSYTTRNTGAADEGKVSAGRYKTSVCALPISPAASQAAAVGEKETGSAPSAPVRS